MSQLKTAKDLVNHLEKPLIRFDGQHMERSNQRNMPSSRSTCQIATLRQLDNGEASRAIGHRESKVDSRRSKTQSQEVEAALARVPKNESAVCTDDRDKELAVLLSAPATLTLLSPTDSCSRAVPFLPSSVSPFQLP